MPTGPAKRSIIFYDGDCSFCTGLVERLGPTLESRGFAVEPLQTPGTAPRLGISSERLLDEMRLRRNDGRVFGGAAAVAEIARRIWWAWPLWMFSRIPAAMWTLDAGYKWIARRRGCTARSCRRA